MGLSDVMDIATAGLVAQRTRMTVTASNIASVETTRTAEGTLPSARSGVQCRAPAGRLERPRSRGVDGRVSE